MNQTFEFSRWRLLVGRHWAENRKRYGLALGALMGMMILWYVFVISTDPARPLEEGMQLITYFFGLFLAGSFYASQFFHELGSKPRAIEYLLTPASNLEKLLSGLFYMIVFFILYTLAFYIVNTATIALVNAVHSSYDTSVLTENGPQTKQKIVNVFYHIEGAGGENINSWLLLLYVNLQAAFLLGSVYFTRYSFIKTVILIAICMLAMVLGEAYFSNKLIPNGGFRNGLSSFGFWRGNQLYQIQLPGWIDPVLRALFFYGLMPVLWTVTYFRLKEKEV
ncbi:MAG TPA: hypothetical protein VHK69_13840 [Chitinophagaceae bacterium]|jgi:hypothetical protein|nr:hypothetical protein [Chitinophagaceae bacterium]